MDVSTAEAQALAGPAMSRMVTKSKVKVIVPVVELVAKCSICGPAASVCAPTIAGYTNTDMHVVVGVSMAAE